MADDDIDDRKVFVGGLRAAATADDLRNYFGKYGTIVSVEIKIDEATGHSRGFGFMVFEDESSVQQIVSGGEHEVAGKKVEVKRAKLQKDETNNKIFVGGLDKKVTESEIRSAFGARGVITNVFIPIDSATNEGKGFAFVTFKDSSLASTLCAEGVATVGSNQADVKPAKNHGQAVTGGVRGRGGGRGSGRGSFTQFEGYGDIGYERYGGGGSYEGYGNTGYESYGGYEGYGSSRGGYSQFDGYGTRGGYGARGGYGSGGDRGRGGLGDRGGYGSGGDRGRGGLGDRGGYGSGGDRGRGGLGDRGGYGSGGDRGRGGLGDRGGYGSRGGY